MIWFIAEDSHYYSNIDELKAKYKLADIIIFPSGDDIRSNLRRDCGFIAPYYPPKNVRSMFVIKHLENKFGILTSQEKEHSVSESIALESRLGLSVIDSPFGLDDVGGAEALKEWTKQLQAAEVKGYRAKGIFLVGVPGTGKTFFPKCFAGQTKRLLIMLNLSMIMESEEPINKLNQIFAYLSVRYEQKPHEKYIILIDEIEKMIGNNEAIEKRIIGRLLTVLNDLNTPASEYKFNAIFFATANNLNSILDHNPELLRRGRWDELFFINLPSLEQAESIFNIYLKKFQIGFIKDIYSMDNIMAEIEHQYQEFNNQSSRFPYTASEIETFCKRISFVNMAKDSVDQDDIIETVSMIIPIIKSSQEGINRITAQKELFLEI
ncbi:MAG: AAA family ATPase [Campylobacteraceae bacterium]|nr:AAA family ATPase [Campylobacteraceae bacterium]